MTERYLHHLRVEWPASTETAAEARLRLADKFPRSALRRMTHLGLLLGSVLENSPLTSDDAIVYATSYAETRALEDYLRSFPAASPLLFQTSIHPGGIQQVLIGRQQPIARLWPMAGRARLVEHALMTALIEPAAQVAVIGGEERGTWMLDLGYASAQPFAFGFILTRDSANAVGCLKFTPAADPSEIPLATAPCPSLESFTQSLLHRRPLGWPSTTGRWEVLWR